MDCRSHRQLQVVGNPNSRMSTLLKRAKALSRFHRPRRQVENPPSFQAAKSPRMRRAGRFLRRKIPFSCAKIGEDGRRHKIFRILRFCQRRKCYGSSWKFEPHRPAGEILPVRLLVKKAVKLLFREALPGEKAGNFAWNRSLFAMGSAVFGAISPIMTVFCCSPAATEVLRGLPSLKVF